MTSFVSESAALHPSTFIVEEMKARGWTVDRLAIAMGSDNADFMAGVAINNLALDMYITVGPDHRDVRLGPTMTTQLAVAFGTSVEFWSNLEKAWVESLRPAEVVQFGTPRGEVEQSDPEVHP